jgi:hypothetical protein
LPSYSSLVVEKIGHPILLLANVAHLFQRVAKVSEVADITHLYVSCLHILVVAKVVYQFQKLQTLPPIQYVSWKKFYLPILVVAKGVLLFLSMLELPHIFLSYRSSPLIPLVAQVAYIFQYLQL